MPIRLRFSSVSPREVAEVKRLRDRHRGVSAGAVPEGVEEQAVAQAVQKARPLLAVLSKVYVRSHTRTLPDGRHVTIPAYFTKVMPKREDTAGRQRGVKQAPPAGVHTGLTPEQLAHRLVRHVREGTLTHEEAEANVAHLERRAQRGQGLQHGHGPDWEAKHLHEFVAHARGGLAVHRREQYLKQQEDNARIRQQEEEEITRNRAKNEQEEKRRREEIEQDRLETEKKKQAYEAV